MTEPHARAFDLPGWPCPPRVRDIADHEKSWGWVPVSVVTGYSGVAIDELGYLWVNGDKMPRFKVPSERDDQPGALVFWTAEGLGLWVPRNAMKDIASISRLDMKPGEWLKVAVVAAQMPDFMWEEGL